MKRLLSVGFTIDDLRQKDDMALAAKHNDYELIEFLLEKDPNNHECFSFLVACELGNVQAVAALFPKLTPLNVTVAAPKGLAVACGRGWVGVIKILLDSAYPSHMLCKSILLNAKDDALYEAVIGNQHEILRFLSKYCWKRHRTDLVDLACANGHWRIVEVLLRANTAYRLDSPEKKAKNIRSNLFFERASDEDELRAVQFFIRRGLPLDLSSAGYNLTSKQIGLQMRAYLKKKYDQAASKE